MLAYLTLTAGQKPGRSFVLQPGIETLIGRGPECQVVLADPECSRVHAVLAESEGRWQVRDQSRNGTFVNGEVIQEAFLAEGSLLRLGATELAFHQGEQSPTLAAPLDAGLTQTIVRDTPVTEHDSSGLGLVALGDSPEAQDLWRLHQFSVRLLSRRPRTEILRDAMQVLQERTEASSAAYFAVDHHEQLRLKLAAPDGASLGPLPGESLTRLVITQGRALWVANQHARGRSGGASPAATGPATEHEADLLYLPLLCGNRVGGALYVYLKQGHFRQSQFEFAMAVAHLASRALARAREDDHRECNLAEAAAELGVGQDLIGPSPAVAALREQLTRIAGVGRHILLRGERGAGKRLVARWLHEAGAKTAGQAAGPFVVYPCGQAEPNDQDLGLDDWGQAEGGTLYLAEIGRLPPAAQQALLQRLAPTSASRQDHAADGLAVERVIAGTSIDLRVLVRRGEFAQELIDALSEHEVEVPPLRERRDDIPVLVDRFLSLDRLRSGRPDLSLSEAARGRLVEHDWPGNAGQLRLALQWAALTATGPVIETSDLPLGGGAAEEWESLRIDHWERRLITLALQRAGGNVPEAAKLLGIGRATLYRKLEEYGIQR